MCKVCRCACDNCIACRAADGCGCATEGHVDYCNCGCTEGGDENAW